MSPDPRSVKKRKAAAVVEENLPDTHEEEDGDAQEAEDETPVKINTQVFLMYFLCILNNRPEETNRKEVLDLRQETSQWQRMYHLRQLQLLHPRN